MFLPTRPHDPIVTDGQYKLRLGRRVPKDAVNLAYTHLPEVTPSENVQVTDLSSTILENAKNALSSHIYATPDDSLLLRTEDGQQQFGSEDVLMTNIFENDTPLFYSYELAYQHYDQRGPDRYGMYQGEGISVVDQLGRPIDRPYKVQLIETKEEGMYRVIVYTSFKDAESDTYQVVYNAIELHPDGRKTTKAGHKESLSLKGAFEQDPSLDRIMVQSRSNEPYPKYYQANGSSPGYSKIYVPTLPVLDTRHREYFQYQVILEVTRGNKTSIYTTPWLSGDVMNYKDLTEEELADYPNGSKRITNVSAEKIMAEYINLDEFAAKGTVKKFIVRSNNDRVQLFTRIDGTGEMLATTNVAIDNDMQFPIKYRRSLLPELVTGRMSYTFRPLMAKDTDIQHIAFVIDHSSSMKRNDPNKKNRYSMMKDLLASATDFYKQIQISAHTFNYTVSDFTNGFMNDPALFLDRYDRMSGEDRNDTQIAIALKAGIDRLETIPTKDINKKTLIFITDGEVTRSEEQELLKQIARAAALGIQVGVITFNNYQRFNDTIKYKGVSIINALSTRISAIMRYYFFDLSRQTDAVTVKEGVEFEISPDDGDKLIHEFKPSLTIPESVRGDIARFGIETTIEAHDAVSHYLLDIEDKKLLTINGATIFPLEDLVIKKKPTKLYAKSELHRWKFSPIYAVKYNDSQQIRVLSPAELSSKDSWYLRIRSGRFSRMTLDALDRQITYNFGIPEYYRQQFDKEKGHPYMSVRKERAKMLSEYEIQVSRTPLYVTYNGANATNATVWVNDKKARIRSSRSFDGIFELEQAVTANDVVYVDYQYEEDCFIYRGYYDEEKKQYFSLDLNPSAGHYITVENTESGEIYNADGFILINKTIYIYLRALAALVDSDTGDLVNDGHIRANSIFHSFEKIDYDPTVILLAEVRVRPNSNQNSIQIMDTRSRGGGLKPEINEALIKEFQPESLYYWDIGHWDGTPYSENAVVTFRISRSVLKEYGGQFTKAEVEDKVNKHLGYGVFPIIEFTEDSDYLLEIPRNLTAEVFDVEEDGTAAIERPTFDLSEV